MGLFDDLMKSVPAPAPEIKPDTPHFEAIGRFVTTFATAEAAIHMLARHLSSLSDEKARIVFGGMRLPDLADIIRHFMRIDNLDAVDQECIEGCLRQIVLISKRRHSVVHRSTNFFDGKLLVTNVLTTKSLKATESEIFEIQELSDMQADCHFIYLRLDNITHPDRKSEFDALAEAMILRGPWRYKPLPPKTPNLKPRAKSQKPKHQPPASRGKPS
jgi:hypothetical protein